jgi:hypothetical protein
MAERKAKLAIVVRRCRRVIIVRRRYYGRRAWRRERVRVMVPGPEHGLEKDCKDAEKGGFLARSPPSSADPNPCGHAQRHVDFPSPQCHAPRLTLFGYVSECYHITRTFRISNRLVELIASEVTTVSCSDHDCQAAETNGRYRQILWMGAWSARA